MAIPRLIRGDALFAALLVLASAQTAFARPRLTCVSIRTDETVAAVATRLTGDARNMQAPWFQIVNPTTSRPVPKARYGFIFAGWSACIVYRPGAADLFQPFEPADLRALELVAEPPSGAAAAVVPGLAVARLASPSILWIPAVMWCTVVLLCALTYWVADEYFARRQRMRREMKRFADRFVQEFERPLIQPHRSQRPVQSRVRFKPGRSRFDVLLAPQDGLRYPNLTDHKRNVVYDVVRIQEALSEHAFVSSRPYARGRWVVIPFKLRVPHRT